MKKTNYTPSALIMGLLCLGLAACSKSDGANQSPISYPLEVKATALEEQGPVKLYTKDGEVTDQAVIDKFIAHPPAAVTLSFNEKFKPEASNIITFMTDSTASFGYSAVLYHVKKNGDNEIGFSTDFILEYNKTDPYDQLLDAYHISKTNEPLSLISATSGLGYKGTSLTVAQGGYRSFRFPILLYYLRRAPVDPKWFPEGKGIRYSANKLFNEFNPDFVSRLGARDTIAVQQSWVRYKE